MPSIFTRIFSQSKDLATCPYANEAFSELVTKIQAAIDRLNLEGYANLEHQVAELDKDIEGVLLQRLEVWCSAFDRTRWGS
ncbi:hypothetical protein PILCRDRAFT_8938 [Piloderma croceum F 1598]|uniref:Uncharacterized protein n=1 Tax=Piloderma croceum (strain F 1598) TaxID=765440 RepID=A0A0C3FNG1_PILCF|nr:hypothetical protein PILCRDRAFT_8938 [Piloderma croceum F 1598]